MTPAPRTTLRATGRRHPRSRWLWLGYWAMLFVVMHVPVARAGSMPIRHGDKLVHFAVYYLLTWLGGRYGPTASGRTSATLLLIWAIIYTAYAALDEWLQPLVGRTMSAGDFLADVAGIAAATVVLAARRHRATVSEHGHRVR